MSIEKLSDKLSDSDFEQEANKIEKQQTDTQKKSLFEGYFFPRQEY